MGRARLEIRGGLDQQYPDVPPAEAMRVLEELGDLDAERKVVMAARIERRAARFRNKRRIELLDPKQRIPRPDLRVQDAREGKFIGSSIPHDLTRQWIQGTGPATRPGVPGEQSLRHVAYGLLSGGGGGGW